MPACPQCGTEVRQGTLACPACGALIYAQTLKELASNADRASQAGELLAAREHWQSARSLLPLNSRQHAVVGERIAEINRRIDGDAQTTPGDPAASSSGKTSGWSRIAGGAGTAALILGSKLKFLLLGLTKASTFVSMFAFFGVYWSVYGWPLALGLVVTIYIHEMGHVAMLRRLGIDSSAPLFIPGMGALVMLRQHITDPVVDAKIGLAGPVWGLGAALASLGAYFATDAGIWLAIAHLTAFLNLFNLIPIWQLDGSRGFHALSRTERWIVVAAIAVALMLTEQRLLILIAAAAVWRALQKEQGPGNQRVLATFLMLVAALSLIARGVS
jgi:Zn-dependent protease